MAKAPSEPASELEPAKPLWRRILEWPGSGRKRTGRRGIAIRVGRTAVLLVVCSVVLLKIFERKVTYHPTKATERDSVPAAVPGIDVEQVWLETADGVRIYGWFVDSTGTDRAMLYFHGNAGNLFDREDWIVALARLRLDLMVIDYRGYGRSEGSPTEEGLYMDAEAAYLFLTETRGVPPGRIVVYGESLGGGPACEIARRFPCAGLILQSAFTSIPDMANRIVPVLPVGWLAGERYDNETKVAGITVPKLIIHSRPDQVVPFWMGEALYEAAAEPKKCVWFDEGTHGGLHFQKRKELLKAFGELLDQVVPMENSGPSVPTSPSPPAPPPRRR